MAMAQFPVYRTFLCYGKKEKSLSMAARKSSSLDWLSVRDENIFIRLARALQNHVLGCSNI